MEAAVVGVAEQQVRLPAGAGGQAVQAAVVRLHVAIESDGQLPQQAVQRRLSGPGPGLAGPAQGGAGRGRGCQHRLFPTLHGTQDWRLQSLGWAARCVTSQCFMMSRVHYKLGFSRSSPNIITRPRCTDMGYKQIFQSTNLKIQIF